MRYIVKCDKKYLNDLKGVKIKDLTIEGDYITFKINDLNTFHDIEFVDIIDTKKIKLRKFIKYNIFTFIGLIVFCFIFFIMSKTVTEIKFVDKDKYKKEVYESVNSYLYKINKFAFLNDDLTNINKEIRSKYYMYQWISVKKEGTVLLIDIIEEKDIITENNKKEISSLYSGYDAVIEGYYIEEGSSNIKVNRSVSKGDLLISGNIKEYDGNFSQVCAKGYVIGTVIDEVKVNISKSESYLKRTGKKEKKNIYIFNDKSLNNPISKFENYEVKYKTILNLGFFKIKKATYYELKEEVKTYSLDEAVNMSIELIENDFIENKKYDFEEIIEKRIISKTENEYDYEILYFLKKKIDITVSGKIDNINNE